MPAYEYACTQPACSTLYTVRRLFSEMNDPLDCTACGEPCERVFIPTNQVHIPVHMKQVLTGGAAGPGQLSRSDFHGETEREMAKNPHIERRTTWASQAGHGR